MLKFKNSTTEPKLLMLYMLASHNHNFNISVQHVSVSSSSRPPSDSCFHNRANSAKISKTVRD